MVFGKPDPQVIQLSRQLDAAGTRFQRFADELFGLHEQFDGRWRNAEQLAELKRLARQAEDLAREFNQQSRAPDPEASHLLAAYARKAGIAAVALLSPLLVGMGEEIGSELYQRWFDPTVSAAEQATDAAAKVEVCAVNVFLDQADNPNGPATTSEPSDEDEDDDVHPTRTDLEAPPALPKKAETDGDKTPDLAIDELDPTNPLLIFDDGTGVEMPGDLLIGRRPDPSVRDEPGRLHTLTMTDDSQAVSRNHVELRRDGDETLIIDCGSANGTFVEATPGELTRLEVEAPHQLRDGERVIFGKRWFEYRACG